MTDIQDTHAADAASAGAYAAELFAAAIDPELALRAALQRAVPDFADWCVVDYYAASGELKAVHSGYHDARQERLILEIRRRYRNERGENGDVLAALRTGEQLLYADMTPIASVRLSDVEASLLDELDLRSSVVVPMHVDGQPLGVVSFVSKSRVYDELDLASAREFAAGCGQVLAHWRQRREIDRSLALLETLYATSPVGLAFIDTDLRFRRVNECMAAMHGVPVDAHLGRTLAEVLGALGDGLAEVYMRVLEEQEPVSFDLAGETAGDPGATRHWHVSYVPVKLDDEVLGVNAVVQDISERKRAATRAAFLARASELLDSTLDYRKTLQSVARMTVPEMADWCSISMLNARGEMYRVAVAHCDPDKDRLAQKLIEREALPLDAPAGASTAIRSADTQVIEDFSEEMLVQSLYDEQSREIVRQLGIGSSISVPLVAHGRILGAISLVAVRAGRFDAEDVQVAEELARRAAVNIDNARLYTEHTRIARTLQAGLLPRSLPHIPGLELAARYRPAGELIEVGGDFYDVYLRSADEWLVVIGDVTGKGAEAAATTGLIRYTLRAAAQHPGSPSQLLRELNAAMLAQHSDYCTIGLVSVRSSGDTEATICLGGHPSPVLLTRAGKARAVGAPGTMLGFFDDAQFAETRITLQQGEILVLYTDGLTEAAAPPGWSEEQLEQRLLEAATDEDLDSMLARLEAGAIDDAQGHPRDDIALLALRRGALAD
jgi:PAS domain S-box-containing protein